MTVGRLPNIEGGIQPTLLTTTGDIMYASSASNPTRLGIGSTGQVLTVASGVPSWATPASAIPANAVATVATSETTTSTSYTDLTTAGPAVTVTTGTKALVIVSAQVQHTIDTGDSFMAYAVSGATTTAATDTTCLVMSDVVTANPNRASAASVITVTAGSNTFTAKYRSGGGGSGANFRNREIFVMNLA